MTKLFLSVFFLFMSFCVIGQSRTIKGKVNSNDGKAIPSASVSAESKTVITDNDGQFSIDASAGKITVTISAVGYNSQTVEVSANQSFIQVSLAADLKKLDPVVVTALGISKKSRTLSYSTQAVQNSELTTVKNTNVINSLSGKVAGLQVSRTSGGAGGSVKVVLRGNKSTTSSDPLYVIDGMPVVNVVGGPDAGLYNSAPDPGDIMSTINPDDIESINVLKGASATALYGSRGGNGVILITTKKGKAGTSKIDFSSNITFDNAAILPKQQFGYGQSTAATTSTTGSEDSWGAKGATMPGSNYLKDFYNTGVTFINSIGFSAGNEKSSNYFSYSNTDNKGILPTSKFQQHTVNYRLNSKFLNDKLIFDANVNASFQKAHNRLTPGIYYNPLPGLYLFPRGLDFNAYKNYEYFSQSRYLYAQNWWNINYDKDQANGGGWGGQDYQQNPYWVLNRNPIENKNQNIYASASLKYLLSSWLTLQARGNYNMLSADNERKVYATTQSTLARSNGAYSINKFKSTNLYGDLILLGDKAINKDLSFNFTLGTSIEDNRKNTTSINGTPTVANVFIESALDRSNISITNSLPRRQIQSLFGSVQFGYRNMLFLELSDRNDWSSTLAGSASEKNGFNYYSAGLSAVVSDMVKMPEAIDFAKLRVSYATVGHDVTEYAQTSTIPQYTFNGGMTVPPNSYAYLGVKPERNNTIEIGAQMSLLKNRLSLDLTWYKSNSKDQFFQAIDLQTINTKTDINAGNIENKGIEASISFRAVKTKSFTWTTALNFARNTNKIVELFDPNIVRNVNPSTTYGLTGGAGYSKLRLGGSFGDLYGRTIQTDAQGRMVVDNTTHLPVFVDSLFGNSTPKFLLGWSNTFTYNRFTLSALVDGKFGGQAFSITEGYMDQMGVSERTGNARDNGGTVAINNAVTTTGQSWSGTVGASDYYKAIGGKTPAGSQYVYDATTVRLRELSISYQIPVKSKVVRDFRFGVVANNLIYFVRKAPFDPEQVAGVTAGSAGIDAFGLPATRSIGFNLKCSF